MPRVDYHEPDITEVMVPKMRVKSGEIWTTQENVRAFQCQCACGYHGPVRSRPHEADYDCMEHRIAENEG